MLIHSLLHFCAKTRETETCAHGPTSQSPASCRCAVPAGAHSTRTGICASSDGAAACMGAHVTPVRAFCPVHGAWSEQPGKAFCAELRTMSFKWPGVTPRKTILLLFCFYPIKTSLFISFRELFAIVFVHSSVVYLLLEVPVVRDVIHG